MKRQLIVALCAPLLLGGCLLNALKGPEDFDRNYSVALITESIDHTAALEAKGKSPIPNRDLSPRSWRYHWEQWFDVWRHSDGAAGTHAAELIEHARQTRRALGLPELEQMRYLPREKGKKA